MSEQKLRALKFEVIDVGKHIKSSKKRYFWSVSIAERYYNFLLDDSIVSGKSKLSINGKTFHEISQGGHNQTRYEHSFIIDGCLFSIVQTDDSFEMRINNKLFSHMLTQEMGLNEFKEHTVEESSFQLAEKLKQTQPKKITLSLPGMANAMKKKKAPTVQTQNWNELAGSSGFPNFFEQTSVKECNPVPCKVQCQPEPIQVKPDVVKVPTAEQFSTLQNLFKTITACGQYVPKVSNEATPTYDLSQIPAIPQVNLQEFNTMQNLFSTINNQPPIDQQKVKQAPKHKIQDFNTMQNLFSTLQMPQQVKRQTKTEPAKTNLQDFSTMQNLFSTVKQPPAPSPPAQLPLDISKININDFNTLQNLFATGFAMPSPVPAAKQLQKPTEQQFHTVKCEFSTNSQAKLQPLPDMSKINLNDFSTIQNLFSTNTFAIQKDVLGCTDKNNKAEQPLKKIEKPANSADFNTMQNLFATHVKIQKNQNAFWKF